MDVEDTPDSLLKTECYVCMEPCVTRSPCECQSHVHVDCLITFIETSGNTDCTICNGPYVISFPEPWNKRAKEIVCLLFGIGLFFPLGWLGSCMLDACQDYDPFSVNSLCSALSVYFIIILIWVCYRR